MREISLNKVLVVLAQDDDSYYDSYYSDDSAYGLSDSYSDSYGGLVADDGGFDMDARAGFKKNKKKKRKPRTTTPAPTTTEEPTTTTFPTTTTIQEMRWNSLISFQTLVLTYKLSTLKDNHIDNYYYNHHDNDYNNHDHNYNNDRCPIWQRQKQLWQQQQKTS